MGVGAAEDRGYRRPLAVTGRRAGPRTAGGSRAGGVAAAGEGRAIQEAARRSRGRWMDGGRGCGGRSLSRQGRRRESLLAVAVPFSPAVAVARPERRVGLLQAAAKAKGGDCWAVLIWGWAIGLERLL